MIRFVDLTEAYWTDPEETSPCCAFLDTRTDTFRCCEDGWHVFDTEEQVAGMGPRFSGLVPQGFWGGSKHRILPLRR